MEKDETVALKHTRYFPRVLPARSRPGHPEYRFLLYLDGECRRSTVRSDLKHRTPLGEPGALGVVLLSAFNEAVQARAPGLHLVPSGEGGEPGVYLDAGDNTDLVQAVHKGGAVGVVLEERLLVQDGSGDVVSEVGCGEEHTCAAWDFGWKGLEQGISFTGQRRRGVRHSHVSRVERSDIGANLSGMVCNSEIKLDSSNRNR